MNNGLSRNRIRQMLSGSHSSSLPRSERREMKRSSYKFNRSRKPGWAMAHRHGHGKRRSGPMAAPIADSTWSRLNRFDSRPTIQPRFW